jgi:hypothetical protein
VAAEGNTVCGSGELWSQNFQFIFRT